MDKMTNKISIRALTVKKLPPLFPLVPNSSNSSIRCQCDLKLRATPSAPVGERLLSDNLLASNTRTYVSSQRTKNSTRRPSPKAAPPSNEVFWEGKAGMMTWNVSDQEVKRLR